MTDAPTTDINERIDALVKGNDIVLFMKGTPLFPQCGFSSRAIAILEHLGQPFETVDVLADQEIRQGIKAIFGLADDPAALREGRIRRRIGHHDGDVRERRTEGNWSTRKPTLRRNEKGAARGTRKPLRRPFDWFVEPSGRN